AVRIHIQQACVGGAQVLVSASPGDGGKPFDVRSLLARGLQSEACRVESARASARPLYRQPASCVAPPPASNSDLGLHPPRQRLCGILHASLTTLIPRP